MTGSQNQDASSTQGYPDVATWLSNNPAARAALADVPASDVAFVGADEQPTVETPRRKGPSPR